MLLLICSQVAAGDALVQGSMTEAVASQRDTFSPRGGHVALVSSAGRSWSPAQSHVRRSQPRCFNGLPLESVY